jgi:UDP-3-O-[3-hydroxymyristoyl] glucosamine N-acyltransferase
VAIAGSTAIGKHCIIAGAVGIAGHLTIVDGVTVTAMTGVSRSIRKRGVYSGSTLMQPSQEWRRNLVRSGQLDDMYRRLRDLERELAEMKEKTGRQ